MHLNQEELKKARAEFFLSGQSIADWARANHFRRDLVYAVLSGRSKATRGQSHLIAMRLGLKARSTSDTPPEAEEIM